MSANIFARIGSPLKITRTNTSTGEVAVETLDAYTSTVLFSTADGPITIEELPFPDGVYDPTRQIGG
jgi:hypothetical protein